MSTRLVEERVWERREEFLMLNPAGTTPVLVEEGVPPVPGAAIIAEYIDETRGATAAQFRLMPGEPAGRIEVRRLMSWFNDKFFAEASGALVMERVYKRFIPAGKGGGPPDTDIMRAAKGNIRYHLTYIGWLIRRRDWLAGDKLSYADLAAAAHLSAVDYLGDVPWDEDETAKAWYARIKSRPSFRALLGETLPGLPPSPTTPISTSDARRRSRRRSPRPRARRASTRSASRGRTRSRARPSGCATSSPPAPTATWTGWRKTPTGAAIRACCGRTCARSSCSASITARTAIRWRSCKSACMAPSRSTPKATIITT